jgi:hypothetical protein
MTFLNSNPGSVFNLDVNPDFRPVENFSGQTQFGRRLSFVRLSDFPLLLERPIDIYNICTRAKDDQKISFHKHSPANKFCRVATPASRHCTNYKTVFHTRNTTLYRLQDRVSHPKHDIVQTAGPQTARPQYFNFNYRLKITQNANN